jgi:anthranilate phosphoribosyltransferase
LLDRGEGDGAARSALVLNAGAALYVAGLESSFPRAVERARVALDAGKGRDALARVRAAAPRGSASAA